MFTTKTQRAQRTFGLVLCVLCVFVVENRSEIIDRIVATAGKQIITLSDAEREQRIESFLAGREPAPLTPAGLREVVQRLLDQVLIRREMLGGSFPLVEAEKVEPQLEEIRRRFPDPAAFQAALGRYGLNESEIRRYLQFRADVSNFIDFRVRPGLQVTPEEVERYYRQDLLPELRRAVAAKGVSLDGRRNAPEPGLEEVREKIVALLLEKQVSQRLAAWLQELRSQAEIRLLLP